MLQSARAPRRLVLTLVLALVATVLVPTAASADSIRIDFPQPSGPEYSTGAVGGEAGTLYTRKVRYALDYAGASHLVPGSRVVLRPTGLPAEWTVSDLVFEIPADWGPMGTTTVRADATAQWMRRPAINENYSLIYVPHEYLCGGAATDCVTPSQPRSISTGLVHPRPITDFEPRPGVNDAIVTWTPSPDLTHEYLIQRVRSDGQQRMPDLFLPAPATSWRDEGPLDPDTEYCFRVVPLYVVGTQKLPALRHELICRRTGHNPPAPASAPAATLGDGAEVTIDWDAAPEGDVAYELEYRDANDSDWRPLANDLTATEHTVADHPEGTWDYRVRTTNSHRGTSDWVESADELKVDKTAPAAPNASTREPDFQGWFKDSVTVSWAGSTDPALADGSPGSGVAGYSPDETVSANGQTAVRGRARDAAGNESAETTHHVLVDADRPVVTIDCPTDPVQVGDEVYAQWRADDEGVGIDGPGGGGVRLDTTSRGEREAVAPVVSDSVGHESEDARCSYQVKARPTAPGQPRAPEFDQDGSFDISWDPSTDEDDDALTYQVIGRRGNESYALIGSGLTSPTFTTDELAEGTWDFGVRAVESQSVMTNFVFAENVTKVDRTAPGAPQATTDPATPADEIGGWFKDSVTVSFGESTDPDLGDGSPGSGVASYSDSRTFDSTGEHTATGTATDRAGNRSDETSRTVKVDATAPTVEIECPTGPVNVGSDQSATWTAADEGSGLATPGSGSEQLDTATPGEKTITSPAPRDNVGHEGETDSCDYVVNAPPTAPGTPAGPEFDRDGTFDLTWTASEDADEDDVTYAVERRESGDSADWVSLGDDLTAAELRVTDTPEGTYDFRVRASDPTGSVSDWAQADDLVKVDGTKPSAPAGTTAPAAPAEGSGGWFKDSVTVSFGGSSDPDLRDGSAGSGVDAHTDPATFDTSGDHSRSGRATDRAGNESDATTVDVKVDATAPVVDADGCPTQPVLEGTDREVTWTARDAHSGLAGADSGEVTLDTSTPGENKVAEVTTARDKVGHETTVRCEYDVYANTPPSTPGAPNGPAVDRDGEFGLAWTPAGDGDTDAGDSFTYELQRRDADDGDWTAVADGLTQAERQVDVDDGTWTFRVRAVDSFGAASDWAVSEPVKVDGVKPTAPTASPTGDGWHRDRVEVTFDGSTDPALADGSAGSGVGSYSGNAVFDTTGTHTATGFATDHAGNESDKTTKTVKVDATAPSATITCPTEELIVGQTAKANWTASDQGSGLATPASGAVTLDTSTAGTRTATTPVVKDNVGHTKTATCAYEVRYRFAGTIGPVEGSNVVNVGRRWKKYPIRWRLTTWSGATISDARGIELAREMSVSDDRVACTSFLGMAEDPIESEDPTATQSVRYDTGSNSFIYAYEAPSIGCYTVDIRKADGVNTKRWRFLFLP
jgi:hypothetical protein